MQTGRIMKAHIKRMGWMLSMTTLTLLLSILLACGPADEPVPPPTICVTVAENTDGTTVEECGPGEAAVERQYTKLPADWDRDAQEAEELAKSNRKRSDVDPNNVDHISFYIIPDDSVEGAVDTITAFLKKKGVTYVLVADGDYTMIWAGIPLTVLGPLSDLPAFGTFRMENPTSTQ